MSGQTAGQAARDAWFATEYGSQPPKGSYADLADKTRGAWEAAATAGSAPVAAERDKAYGERADLVAFVAAAHADAVIVYQDEDDEWPVVIIETRAGQLSWHIAKLDLGAFSALGLPVLVGEQRWDGHDTPEKYRRLAELSRIVGNSAPAWWAGTDGDEAPAEPQAAPELAMQVRHLRDALERCRDAAGRSPAAVHTIAAQALASNPAPEQAAPELAAAMGETRRYREALTAEIGRLETSAKISHPSRKSVIEADVAGRLRKILEGS